VLGAVVASTVLAGPGPARALLARALLARALLARALLAGPVLASAVLAGAVPEGGRDERRADRACRGELPGQPGDPAQARIPGRDR
jgi:hypothetical protein